MRTPGRVRVGILLVVLSCGCTGRIMTPSDTDDAGVPAVYRDGAPIPPVGSDGGTEVLPDGAEAPDGGGAECVAAPAPHATGTTRELRPGTTLGSLLDASAPGDLILVHAGDYPSEDLRASLTGDVFIEAAPGETATFDGLTFTSSSHLVFRGVRFTSTLSFIGCSDVLLDGIEIDLGTRDESGLYIHGQSSTGPAHHIRVIGSRIHGGRRTIFLHTNFVPSEGWNHDLEFVHNDLGCGAMACFQLSGARDTLIADNLFHDVAGGGILCAGATRIDILRNEMIGSPAVTSDAIVLATPGREWDDYDGVEYMITEDVTVANNLIHSWGGHGIQLSASRNLRIVYNTVWDGGGLATWRRSPTDRSGAVILTGNTDVRLWNNILTRMELDSGDPRPVFESNNLVMSGGGGENLVVGDPSLGDGYEPGDGSPVVDAAIVAPDTPDVDQRDRLRGAAPDIGAIERGAGARCP